MSTNTPPAGAEPSPEARAFANNIYPRFVKSVPVTDPASIKAIYIIAELADLFFAPLRAELERVKGDLTAQIEATRQVKASFDWMQQEHDKETDISCGLRVELAAAKEALQQATARIGELEKEQGRYEKLLEAANTRWDAHFATNQKEAEVLVSIRTQLALAKATAEEARRMAVKCFDESHPDAIG